MEQAGISGDDELVVNRALEPTEGSVAVAVEETNSGRWLPPLQQAHLCSFPAYT